MFTYEDRVRAARQAVREYTRPYIARISQDINGKPDSIGSATCIQIADRLFLSTAAHNFEHIPKGGEFRLFSASASTRTPLIHVAHNYSDYGREGTLDVAWLEIDQGSARENNLAGVPLDLVEPYHEPDPEHINYQVGGFPAELITIKTETPDFYTATCILYNTELSKYAKPHDDHLLLHYSETSQTDEGTINLPHPRGMSGGGVWSVPILEDNQLWSPTKFKVVGITTIYRRSSRQLLAIRMYHWLKLVYDDHPELRKHIEPLLNRE